MLSCLQYAIAVEKAQNCPEFPDQKPNQAAAGQDDSGSNSINAAKAELGSQQGQYARGLGTKPGRQLAPESPGEPSNIGQPPSTPADGSYLQQTHAVIGVPRADSTAQSAPSSTQQEPAGACAAAAAEEAADRPQQLPAGNDQADADVPATQLIHGEDAAMAPARLGQQQAHVAQWVDAAHGLVLAPGAETAQCDASSDTSAGDKLAVDEEPEDGRADALAGIRLVAQSGNSTHSEARHVVSSPTRARHTCPWPQEPCHGVHLL